MRNIIINADDFGKDESTNLAIRHCFSNGDITNTTVMVNMPGSLEAVSVAKDFGFYDKVGLHLNLTAGTPLTGAIRGCQRFCNGNGDFHAGFHLSTKTRLHISRVESDVLRDEIRAQLERYLTFGYPQLHLDSHHHVHTDLSVWNVLEPLLKEYGFKSVRIGRNLYAEGGCSVFNSLYKSYFNGRVKKGFLTTEHFGSYEDLKVQSNLIKENETVELMVHPMFSEKGECMDSDVPMSLVSSFVDFTGFAKQTF